LNQEQAHLLSEFSSLWPFPAVQHGACRQQVVAVVLGRSPCRFQRCV